jgi:DNA-directed RNA polymerase specialized sigma24 family protein
MTDGLEGFERTAQFPTTSWSVIAQTRNRDGEVAQKALGRLCSIYWYPVYALLCRKGLDSDRARDCTQDFFTTLIEKDYLADIERSKGKFRSFLLAAVNHFFSNRLDSEKALKRGGGHAMIPLEIENAEGIYRSDPGHSLTPEALFEYHWARTLLDRTLKRLRAMYSNQEFDVLKPFLVGEAARGQGGAAAQQLGMTEGAFKVAVHRLRKHYRELLRKEIAETVVDPSQVDDEIRYLLKVLAQGGEAGL